MTVHALRTRLEHGEDAASDAASDAFTSSSELIERVGELAASGSPALRGALLWALQLAERTTHDAPVIARLVGPMLDDPEPAVRRRAAYVAGNLGLSLAHRLHTLAAVRNLVTHRAATLAAFRKTYYQAFDELVALA